MGTDEVVRYYQYIEREDLPVWEFEIKVACWIDPGSDGSTNSYGVPMEPSYPPHVEDVEPLEMKFVGGNWHDYDYFVEKWGLEEEIEFDYEKFFELCADKIEQKRIEYETRGI